MLKLRTSDGCRQVTRKTRRHDDWEPDEGVLKRVETTDTDGRATAVRGVLQGAMALYLTRYLNVPPARIPGEDGERLDDLPTDAEMIRTALLDAFDRQQQVDLAARLVARHLTLGHSPKPLIATLAHAVRDVADGRRRSASDARQRATSGDRGKMTFAVATVRFSMVGVSCPAGIFVRNFILLIRASVRTSVILWTVGHLRRSPSTMDRENPDAILMVADALTILNRKRVYDYAAAKRLPAFYEYDFFVSDGGVDLLWR
jgi:hypothetical protein